MSIDEYRAKHRGGECICPGRDSDGKLLFDGDGHRVVFDALGCRKHPEVNPGALLHDELMKSAFQAGRRHAIEKEKRLMKAIIGEADGETVHVAMLTDDGAEDPQEIARKLSDRHARELSESLADAIAGYVAIGVDEMRTEIARLTAALDTVTRERDELREVAGRLCHHANLTPESVGLAAPEAIELRAHE